MLELRTELRKRGRHEGKQKLHAGLVSVLRPANSDSCNSQKKRRKNKDLRCPSNRDDEYEDRKISNAAMQQCR